MLQPSWPKYQPISEPETPHVVTSFQSSRFKIHDWTHWLGFESARAALCKWAACTRQTLSKTFANSLNVQKQLKKNAWEKSNDAYSLSIRVHTTKNHNINVKEKVFFQNASWKRHCLTHWPEQRGRGSYLPRQISQSDCEISSNCGKIKIGRPIQQLWWTFNENIWKFSQYRVFACDIIKFSNPKLFTGRHVGGLKRSSNMATLY